MDPFQLNFEQDNTEEEQLQIAAVLFDDFDFMINQDNNAPTPTPDTVVLREKEAARCLLKAAPSWPRAGVRMVPVAKEAKVTKEVKVVKDGNAVEDNIIAKDAEVTADAKEGASKPYHFRVPIGKIPKANRIDTIRSEFTSTPKVSKLDRPFATVSVTNTSTDANDNRMAATAAAAAAAAAAVAATAAAVATSPPFPCFDSAPSVNLTPNPTSMPFNNFQRQVAPYIPLMSSRPTVIRGPTYGYGYVPNNTVRPRSYNPSEYDQTFMRVGGNYFSRDGRNLMRRDSMEHWTYKKD